MIPQGGRGISELWCRFSGFNMLRFRWQNFPYEGAIGVTKDLRVLLFRYKIFLLATIDK